MTRPAKARWRSTTEIEAAIAAEVAQHDLLQRDLRDALVAGEDTRPYRTALAQTGDEISKLRVALAGLREAEAARRYAITCATALEIAAESQRRHIDLLATLDAPVFPNFAKDFSYDRSA